MLVSLIPQLSLKDVQHSIYKYITDRLRFVIHSAHMTVTGQQATGFECEQLAICDLPTLIQVEQTVFLDNRKLFEYSVARHLWQPFNFENDFVRL